MGKAKKKRKMIKLLMRMAISLLIVGSALFVILFSEYRPETEKWAFGMVGLVVGYWL